MRGHYYRGYTFDFGASAAQKWLVRLLNSHELTYKDLADAIGYGYDTIRHIVDGRYRMSKKLAKLISNEFDYEITPDLEVYFEG